MAQLRELEPDDLRAAEAVLRAAGLDDAAAVAGEKLFGPSPLDRRPRAWAALASGALVGVAASSGRFVRLLAVAPAARRRGLGGALLDAVERDIAARGEPVARTLAQPGNYLAPGVPADDAATLGWLGRRGYRAVGDNTNLAIELVGNPAVTGARLGELGGAAAAAGYQVRRADPRDRGALVAMVTRGFGAAQAFEVELALARRPPATHLALDRGGAVVGFAAHDGNNGGLGWFGPAGTLPEHRGKRLGEALLIACLLDLAAAGHPRATIAWIGPRAFYQRAAGIAGERRFVVLDKELST